jgi:hypothetical protein
MKFLPLAILACLAATPVAAQQREGGAMPQLHARALRGRDLAGREQPRPATQLQC